MTSTTLCPDNRPYELVVFDVRAPDTVERLLSERTAWGEDATVEMLGPDHAALIVHASGAVRIAERGQREARRARAREAQSYSRTRR